MGIPEKEVKIIEEESSILLKQADSYVIKSAQDVDLASEFRKKIKEAENKIEAKRTEFTKPLNQSLNAINATFKRLSTPLKQARELLTERILSWRRVEQERIAKEEERRRKIQEAHKEAGHKINELVILQRPEATMGKSQARKRWTFEIEDFSKVSDKYKVLNSVVVNRDINKGHRIIKGLRIFQKEYLATYDR